MTKQLSTILSQYKIRVNGIAPGYFYSEMTMRLSMFQDPNDLRIKGNCLLLLVRWSVAGRKME